MYCFACSAATHVLNTRLAGNAVRRRRECKTCGARFTTYERDSGAAELEAAVIQFVRSLGCDVGGGNTTMSDLAAALREAGHEEIANALEQRELAGRLRRAGRDDLVDALITGEHTPGRAAGADHRAYPAGGS